jgi:hypothetical protein
MLANHCAVVPKGRAGDLIAIGDAAPDPEESPPALSAEPGASLPNTSKTIAPPAPERAATSLTSTAVSTKKEKKPVPKNILKHLLGLGMKAYAADAEPEDVAKAAEAVNNAPPEAEDDEEEGALEEERVADRKAKDKRKAKDLEEEEEPVAMDKHRKAMHDALDKMLDEQGAGNEVECTDTDLEELKNLLGEYFSEEEAEPEHQAADLEEEPDTAPLDEALGVESEDEMEVGEAGEENLVEDGESPLEEEEEEVPVAMDRARAADGARATLLMLRPAVAQCKDQAVRKAFNAAFGSVTRASRVSSVGDGYAAFSSATRVRAKDTARNDPDAMNVKLQAFYDEQRKKGGK